MKRRPARGEKTFDRTMTLADADLAGVRGGTGNGGSTPTPAPHPNV
jgi:hypothetical protein